MNRKRTGLLVVGALAAVAVAAGGVYLSTTFSTPTAQIAPQVQFTTLQGEKLTTADLRGRVVLVNFWATSCVVCVKEMPDIVATYNRFKDHGFETIAVAMSYDPPNYVLHYAQTNALPFKVVLDTMGDVAREFGPVRLTPTTLIIDKRGHIVARYLGEPNFAEVEKLVAAKLAEKV